MDNNFQLANYRDALTGTWVELKLRCDLMKRLEEVRHATDFFTETFLCCDIDNFSFYAGTHSFEDADAALVELSDKLLPVARNVYRIGGDGFVAEGLAAPIPNLLTDRGLQVRQTLVKIHLPIDELRLNRCASWISAHLHLGLVHPSNNGELYCGSPSDWNRRT